MTTETVEPYEAPTVIDAMQDEATDADKAEWPKNAPELKSYLRLPFRRRAKFLRIFKEVQEMQQELSKSEEKRKRMKNPTASAQIDQASGMYDLFALMDDAMRISAADEDAYDKYVETCSDNDFQQLFAAFMSHSQPGEASSSAS